MARTRTLLLLLGIAAIGAGGYYYWHSRQAAPAEPASAARGAGGRGMGAGMAVPVTLAAASRKDLVLTLDALGTVQALNSVTLRSKVSGQLLEVLFQEGQDVEQGQVLARIDDRTYAASLAQAQAQRAYNQAQLANARLDLQRYEGLLRANGVTRQQVDTQRAQVAMYEAQLAQDQAAIDNARAQLDDTVIRAPFAGRVGLRQVDPGNLVSSSDTNGIVSLAQFTPIAVNFTLPQQELPRLLRAMEAGPVPVETLPSARGESAERGTLLTVGNTVDAATGTIQVKASFPNAQRRLWPGAFVSLRLPVETVPQAVVIPLVAVQQGPAGPFVFVAKEDQTIEQRSLRLGPTTRNEAAVTEGLQPGERVVTSGAQRLNNGSRIQEVTRPAAGAANAGAPGGPEAGAARSRAGGGGGNAAPGGASGGGPDGGAGGGRGAGTPPASTAPGSGAGGSPAQGGGAPASGGSGGARP